MQQKQDLTLSTPNKYSKRQSILWGDYFDWIEAITFVAQNDGGPTTYRILSASGMRILPGKPWSRWSELLEKIDSTLIVEDEENEEAKTLIILSGILSSKTEIITIAGLLRLISVINYQIPHWSQSLCNYLKSVDYVEDTNTMYLLEVVLFVKKSNHHKTADNNWIVFEIRREQ